jgi:hypothetical protein
VQPADANAQADSAPPSQPQSQTQVQNSPAAPLQQIPPPPPPADAPPTAPKTITVGQTKDMVVAILGQPTRVAIIGKKEIDYYPDMKVIFLSGKVSDIQ